VVENPSKYVSFTLQDGFLFKGNELCIPKSPLSDLIIKEAHGGALAGLFGIDKTLDILKDHFYWLRMGEDVHKVISRYNICHMAMSNFHQGLYTPFLVPLGLGMTLAWTLLWPF